MNFSSSAIRHGKLWFCLPLGFVVLITNACLATDDDDVYRVSFLAGAAFNISAKFCGHPGNLNLQSIQSQTGAANFDNGFVGPDVSGDPNVTTFWGYSQADQQVISGGNVTGLNFVRTAVAANATSPTIDADPSPSGEIILRCKVANSGQAEYGVEFGASYTSLGMHDDSAYTTDGQRTGYSFSFPNPIDLNLFPPPNYQGPFNGLGPVLNLNQTTGQTVTAPGAVAVTGSRRVDADVFGFRLGAYLQIPFNKQFSTSISVGAVVAVINDSVKWSENDSANTATENGYWAGRASVSGSHCGVAYGYYLGANVSWLLNNDWSIVGGCKLQCLATYTHKFGQGEMQLDLSQSVFVTLGVSYSF